MNTGRKADRRVGAKAVQSQPQQMTVGQAAQLDEYLRIGYWTKDERAAIVATFAAQMQAGTEQPLVYEDGRGSVTLLLVKAGFTITITAWECAPRQVSTRTSQKRSPIQKGAR